MAELYFIHPFGICDENKGVFCLSLLQRGSVFCLKGFRFLRDLCCLCSKAKDSTCQPKTHHPPLGDGLGPNTLCLRGSCRAGLLEKCRTAVMCREDPPRPAVRVQTGKVTPPSLSCSSLPDYHRGLTASGLRNRRQDVLSIGIADLNHAFKMQWLRMPDRPGFGSQLHH